MRNVSRAIGILTGIIAIAALAPLAGATTLSRNVVDVVDLDPAANVFHAEMSVDEQDVVIDGTTVHAMMYKDDNNPGAYSGTVDGIPVPQITVNVGDEVIVKLTNNLTACPACDTSIHWHGVEVDNDSDGTGVTQNHLVPGETYTYHFRAPRPGVFWFHPHMKPGTQVFAGVYGAFIVKDPGEAALESAGRIPAAANTHTLVLSDTEFDSSGDVGYLDAGGTAVPWETLEVACEGGDMLSCNAVKDGATVLVNGQKPDTSTPTIHAKSGAGIRLRLINVATNRYFRLSVVNNGSDNNLYRIGGEGGFIDQARLEGGILGTWDTKYAKGEILLPSSARADVVVVPTGNDGDVVTITGLGYARGGPSDMNPAGDLLHIVIDNSLADTPFSIAEGSDVLGAGGVEDIKTDPITDFYIDPPPALPGPGSGAGSADETMVLNGVGAGMTAIDGVVGHFEDSGPDFTMVPYQDATRYAHTGDTLEITVSNATSQHHPFHHHGFSFQPVRVVDDATTTTLFEYDYPEFQDVIDVFPGQSVVFRMRLDDRIRITDIRQESGAPAPGQIFASGGAAGRWVFHCHIFLHAAVGMISELVVLDTDRDGDGFDTSQDCNDFDPNINPSAPEICDGIDNDCNLLVDDNTVPPDLTVEAHPDMLWPPNHKLRNVSTDVVAGGAGSPVVTLVSVTSDEDDDGIGDGHTTGDIRGADVGTDDRDFRLRAERSGRGDGRVYTITYEAVDSCGGSATATDEVIVPHDRGKKHKPKKNPHHGSSPANGNGNGNAHGNGNGKANGKGHKKH